MNKIVEYKIVAVVAKDVDKGSSNLPKKVNAMIKDGWQPYGGVFLIPDTEGGMSFQAMVRYEEDANTTTDGYPIKVRFK